MKTSCTKFTLKFTLQVPGAIPSAFKLVCPLLQRQTLHYYHQIKKKLSISETNRYIVIAIVIAHNHISLLSTNIYKVIYVFHLLI